jgi:hypothetical protein
MIHRIQTDFGDVMNAVLALFNDALDLSKSDFAGIVGLTGAAAYEA